MTDDRAVVAETGHVWGAVGPNAAELWNRCVNCRADEGSVQGRLPCRAPVTADDSVTRALAVADAGYARARLRLAAKLMRKRAEGAAVSPWHVEMDEDSGEMYVIGERYIADVHEWSGGLTNPHHIASWHPAVALAVADWLDQAARLNENGSTGPLDMPAALAVANAYLGAASP